MPDGTINEAARWLIQQGVLGIILVLVVWDYRRTMQRLAKEQEVRDSATNRILTQEKDVLVQIVRENTKSNVELTHAVERWVRVTEAAFPRRERRATERGTERGGS